MMLVPLGDERGRGRARAVRRGCGVLELYNFVHGEKVGTVSGRTVPVVDPSTGEAYAEAPVSGPEDVESALGSAKAAFGSWKRSTPSERSLALLPRGRRYRGAG